MTSTPTERLREAAATIRKAAADATPGPWHRPLNTRTRSSVRAPLPEGERGEWINGVDPSTGQRENCTVATIPIWSNGKFSRPRGGRDLEWIALMHPGVGEALAAWLELEAEVIATRQAQPEGGEWAVDISGDHALAVADALLGEVTP